MGSERDSVRDETTSTAVESIETDGGLSPVQRTFFAAVGVILVIWFFVAWLALNRHFLDAAGEAVGTGFALLVIVSIIGALRGSRG